MPSEARVGEANARLYDPVLGRFLSPDPYVQEMDFSQNFNRYSYCWNNPLRYNDPSGEFISTVITAVVGLVEAIARGIVAPWFVGFSDPAKAGRMFAEAWEDYGKQMSNAWKIDMGLFKTDSNKSTGGQIWELISRFTWQLPQTLVGNLIMTGGNIAYQVNNVTYGYGVTAVDMGLDNSAITVGNYTAGPPGYTADWRDHLFVHEYGHYIQSQQWGPLYLFSIGVPSLQSAILQTKNPGSPRHHDRWFEANANRQAAGYFDKHHGSGKDGYTAGSTDYFDKNSFVSGSLTNSPYINPRTGQHNDTDNPISGKFHWTDIPIYIPVIGLFPYLFY
jgi:RHS repeat-associated protein